MSEVFILVGLSYGNERGRVREATGGAREGSEVATKELDGLKYTVLGGGGGSQWKKTLR